MLTYVVWEIKKLKRKGTIRYRYWNCTVHRMFSFMLFTYEIVSYPKRYYRSIIFLNRIWYKSKYVYYYVRMHKSFFNGVPYYA